MQIAKIKTFIYSDNMQSFKHKLFNAKTFIMLIFFVMIDALITYKYNAQEINPLVKQLLYLGIMPGVIMKSAIMLGAITSIYLVSQKNIFARKCLNGLLVLGIITIIFNSFTVLADYDTDYSKYQKRDDSAGFIHNAVSHITEGIGVQYSTSAGSTYQPLTMTIGENTYIVSSSGNFLQLRNQFTGLSNEYNLGGAIFCQPAITNDWNSNGLPEIHIASNSNITIFEFNETNFLKIYSFQIHSAFTTVCNGIRCVEHGTGNKCYLATGTKLWKYDTISYSNMTISSMKAVAGVPAGGDFDNLGVVELALRTDSDTDGNYGIDIIKTLIGTQVCNADDLAVGNRLSNPIAYNIDSAGTTEIILQKTTGSFRVYKPDCTLLWTQTYDNPGGDSVVSQPVIVTADISPLICGYFVSSTITGQISVGCYDKDGLYYFTKRFAGLSNAGCVASTCGMLSLIAGDTNNDGYDELITPQMIFTVKNNMINTSLNLSKSLKGNIIMSDLNGDSESELIYSNTSRTTTLFSSFVNSPPVLNTRTFGQNYCGLICTGTTLNFYAKQCNQTGCHYTNDGAYDTERLITNCGTNILSLTNGTLLGSTPSVSCYYPNSGSYIFNVFLQDNANKNDFSQYHSVNVVVINGTPGQSCNFLPDNNCISGTAPIVTPGVAGGTLTQSDIDYITNTMTGGGSTLVKMLLVIGFTIGLIAYFAKLGVQNPIVFSVGVFALWIVFAIINFLNWIFVIIFAFVMILASAIFFIKGNSQG